MKAAYKSAMLGKEPCKIVAIKLHRIGGGQANLIMSVVFSFPFALPVNKEENICLNPGKWEHKDCTTLLESTAFQNRLPNNLRAVSPLFLLTTQYQMEPRAWRQHHRVCVLHSWEFPSSVCYWNSMEEIMEKSSSFCSHTVTRHYSRATCKTALPGSKH